MTPEQPVKLYVGEYFTEYGPNDDMLVALGAGQDKVDAYVVSRMRLVEDARKLGIVVITQSPDLSDPHSYTAISVVGDDKNQTAELRAVAPDVLIPTTVTFNEYEAEPFFPAVAKHEAAQQGAHKYLLETEEQWERLSTFAKGSGRLRAVSEEDRQLYLHAQQEFARATPGTEEAEAWGAHVKVWENWIRSWERPMSHSTAHVFKFQQFIESPSDRFTSYRVLVSASGMILASSLYYSKETKDEAEPLVSDSDIESLGLPGHNSFAFLTTPGSLVYLGSKAIFSNKSRGGSGVVLDPTTTSKPLLREERPILAAHGINPDNPRLPDVVRRQSQRIGRTIGRNLNIIVGIDWIQQSGTDNFFYIETNTSPGTVAFADARFGGAENVDPEEAQWTMNQAALQSLTSIK